MSDDLRIVLVGAAKAAHDKMLAEVRADAKTTINSSKLINWIVADYFEHFFQRRIKKLRKAHFNERKGFLEAMKIEDPFERIRALQEAARSLTMPTTNRSKRKLKSEASDLSDAQSDS